MQTNTDGSSCIVTGVDVYSANQKEGTVVLRHLENLIWANVPISRVVIDTGYDSGAAHRGLEMLGIECWIHNVEFANATDKKDMVYLPEVDVFSCSNEKQLPYHHLICQKSTGKYTCDVIKPLRMTVRVVHEEIHA